MVRQQITPDVFFDQGTKGDQYWAIRKYDNCSSFLNAPLASWDNITFLGEPSSFVFIGHLKRPTTSYDRFSWIAAMEGRTPWGTDATATSCEIIRKAQTATYGNAAHPEWFPQLASKHWYMTAWMAWNNDFLPATSVPDGKIRTRGLVNLWFKHNTRNQYLVMDLAMILLKNQAGFWVKDDVAVGNPYSVFSVTSVGTALAAHWNKVKTANPNANSWAFTGTALDIDADVTSAMSYNWNALNSSCVNDSNRANWKLWDVEIGIEFDLDPNTFTDSTERCKMASKGLEISYDV